GLAPARPKSGAASALSAPNCCRLDEALATPRRLRRLLPELRPAGTRSSELAACATHQLLPRLPKRRLLAPPLAYLLRLVRRLRCPGSSFCVGCPACTRLPATQSAAGAAAALLLDADLRLAEFFPDCLAFQHVQRRVSCDRGARQIRQLAGGQAGLGLRVHSRGGALLPGQAVAAPRLSLHDCQLSYANHAKLRSASVSAVRLFSNVPESRLPPPPGHSWCSVCARHSPTGIRIVQPAARAPRCTRLPGCTASAATDASRPSISTLTTAGLACRRRTELLTEMHLLAMKKICSVHF
uniref:Secreted protein n=1 Tax=Macrostomum lignano TaxID=282301 RepID=A0A1I8FNX3_9PLAT